MAANAPALAARVTALENSGLERVVSALSGQFNEAMDLQLSEARRLTDALARIERVDGTEQRHANWTTTLENRISELEQGKVRSPTVDAAKFLQLSERIHDLEDSAHTPGKDYGAEVAALRADQRSLADNVEEIAGKLDRVERHVAVSPRPDLTGMVRATQTMLSEVRDDFRGVVKEVTSLYGKLQDIDAEFGGDLEVLGTTLRQLGIEGHFCDCKKGQTCWRCASDEVREALALIPGDDDEEDG
jgi:vacuolar-type H+-ATPase subunit I/STV1